MVKVTKGALPGERAEGYQSYTTSYEVGPGVTVRRGIPTTDLPAVGTSLAQKQQKYSFAVASKTYSKYNTLQQDFFKRWWIIDQTVDPQNRLAKRIITGKQLAIKEIARTTSTSGETYPKPLGFCICAVDLWGNPALGHELNITCPKLGKFEYKEKNDNYACFPPSSLSPKYEPYHLFYTDAADYCLLTAEEIHKIKTLPVQKQEVVLYYQHGGINIASFATQKITWNFAALGLTQDELEILHEIIITQSSVNTTLPTYFWKNHQRVEYFPINTTAPQHYKYYTTVEDGDKTQIAIGPNIIAVHGGKWYDKVSLLNRDCP